MPTPDQALAQHMAQALDQNEEFMTRISEDQFRADWVLQNALIHEMQVFGEAPGRLSEALRAARPDIPWRKVNGLRNRLVRPAPTKHGPAACGAGFVGETLVTGPGLLHHMQETFDGSGRSLRQPERRSRCGTRDAVRREPASSRS